VGLVWLGWLHAKLQTGIEMNGRLAVIKYISIEEQLDADFTRARHKAFLHRMKARLRGDPSSTPTRSRSRR